MPLVTDLEERGLLDDVVIVMGGEFGRTPRMGNQTPDGPATGPRPVSCGWPAAGCDRSDDRAPPTVAASRSSAIPIGMQSVLATVYHVLGIDPGTTIPDYDGRPQVVLDHRSPIAALV